MSILFSKQKIGPIGLPNRFVNSATYEGMAKINGELSEAFIKKYVALAKGGVGLSITGLMYVQASGRGFKYQAGIHDDKMVRGLTQLTDAVHDSGGKIAFQLAHCGRQTTSKMCGQTPLSPSSRGRDPVNFVKPKSMTESEIRQVAGSTRDRCGGVKLRNG